MTSNIQDSYQHFMQTFLQPSWILWSASANRPFTIKWDAFVIFVLKFRYCTPKTEEEVTITVQLLNYNMGTF